MTESDRNDEHRLEAQARALFRRQERGLDAATRDRLRLARERAVAAAREQPGISIPGPFRSRWLMPVAAAAVTAAIVLLLPERTDEQLPARTAQMQQIEPTDLEVLLAAESWSLYEELEFYAALEYLDEEFDAGSG